MTPLLEKLIELVQAWFAYLVPWTVLGDDECGVIRRFGKYKRTMRPGMNLKWPVVEHALSVICALETTVLREQSLTTIDGVQVTVRGVITYRVTDARRYILDCATASSVVNDSGCCVIAELIPRMRAEDVLRGEDFTRDLTKKVRLRAKKWGIHVETFGLIDRTAARTYRFITSARDGGDGLPSQ